MEQLVFCFQVFSKMNLRFINVGIFSNEKKDINLLPWVYWYTCKICHFISEKLKEEHKYTMFSQLKVLKKVYLSEGLNFSDFCP